MHGGVKWSEFPSSSDHTRWPSDVQAMLRGLETRVDSWSSISIDTTSQKITSPTDSRLQDAKYLLNQGHVLQVSMKAGYRSAPNHSGIETMYENTEGGGHSVIIVGYDDNYWYDYNDNNQVDPGEKGAFKMVNSWGTGFGNAGFIWIMYDALNTESAVGNGSWGSSDNRVPVFARTGLINRMSFAQVRDYTVDLAAKINLGSFYKNDLNVATMGRSSQSSSTMTSTIQYSSSKPNSLASARTIVLDYGTLTYPIQYTRSNYKWYLKLDSGLPVISAEIVDNLGNTVTSYGSPTIQSGFSTRSVSLNLKLGDPNFDGLINSSDARMVSQYTVGSVELSNLQFVLADADEDGVVNSNDMRLILQWSVS